MTMNEKQKALCKEHEFDFLGLLALFLNCTLKPTGTFSHTEFLIKVSREMMDVNGVRTEMIRPVDYDLPPGVYPDMTEHRITGRDMQVSTCAALLFRSFTPFWPVGLSLALVCDFGR